MGHTCLFQKGFWTVYFKSKEKNDVILPHSLQQKHEFWEEINEISKTNKLPSRKKFSLELSHKILGHRSTRSMLDGDTVIVWEDIELIIYLDPFCTSCHISLMNKKTRSKNSLKQKSPFKWVLWI